MLYEFAVEPTCLDNWQTFRYLIEQFGVSHGRLISRFPKDWIRLVIEHCSCGSFTFKQKQLIGIEMQRIKRDALIRSGRNYEILPTGWKTPSVNRIKQSHFMQSS